MDPADMDPAAITTLQRIVNEIIDRDDLSSWVRVASAYAHAAAHVRRSAPCEEYVDRRTRRRVSLLCKRALFIADEVGCRLDERPLSYEAYEALIEVWHTAKIIGLSRHKEITRLCTECLYGSRSYDPVAKCIEVSFKLYLHEYDAVRLAASEIDRLAHEVEDQSRFNHAVRIWSRVETIHLVAGHLGQAHYARTQRMRMLAAKQEEP